MTYIRLTGLLTALLLSALLLAGCSSGGGEPTVSQGVYDVLQHELEDTLAELRTEREARRTAETSQRTAEASRQSAQAEVTRLTGLIGNLNDAASNVQGSSLYARLNHATAEVIRLTGDLTTANAEVTELTGRIGSAGDADSLLGMLEAEKAKVTRLTAELETVNSSLESLRGQITTAQTDLAAETDRADQAEQQVQQAQLETQGQEANQRAQNLKTAFPGGTAATLTALAAPVPPVDMTVARGSLRLTRSRHSNAALSGNGIRSATMALTSGGDPGKTVVYTDRELNRPLLEHFGTARDANDMTRFALGAAPLALPSPILVTDTTWNVSHALPTSVAGMDDDNNPDTDPVLPTDVNTAEDPRSSYGGSLHGLAGDFVCAGAGCQVQVTPTYGGLSNGRFSLQSVAVAATGGGTLYFRPSGSPSLQLYEGGPVGVDTEYMVFGYWREDPTSVAGVYHFGVFADTFGSGSSSGFSGTVTYDGVAVGAYVEQDLNDPVDTHSQGEFTADVFLEATSATAVSGTIDDFVVTPTGGSAAPRTSDRWVLTLMNDTDRSVQLNLAGGGANTEGNWTHEFVTHHANTASATDTAPPAVTGVFAARILDFLHLVGSYGAER